MGSKLMENYKPVLNVYLIWHPDAKHNCPELADEIFNLLNHHPGRAFARGIGIPVFYRCLAEQQSQFPKAIDMDAADHTVVFVLVEDNLVCDEDWADYIAALNTQTQQSDGKHLLVPVALTTSAFNLHPDMAETNFVRLLMEDSAELQQALQFHVLHILARLLDNRARQTQQGITLSPSPIKLFISHTKRNDASLQLATAIKQLLDNSQMARFFDSVDIAPAFNFVDEIKANIEQSALLAIRIDQYTESPWCRLEVMEAKHQHRPIIIVDALQYQETRSFSGLANCPCIRFDASVDLNSAESQFRLKDVINFSLQEVLRFCYAREHLKKLKAVLGLPEQTRLLAHVPEQRDIQAALANNQKPLLYPDPPLGHAENEELQQDNIELLTPTTSQGSSLTGQSIGLSISEPDANELNRLGLSKKHLDHAMVELARHLLVQGADLVYGGNLSPGGYTETLMGLVRYHNDALIEQKAKLVNYLAWPLWSTIDISWQAQNKDAIKIIKINAPEDLQQSGNLNDLPAGSDINKIDPYIWARCLSDMREQLIQNTGARILLGGKLSHYKGKYPGIVEEALLALKNQQALFLLGGYGGAAAAVIQALQGLKAEKLTADFQRRNADYAKSMDDYNQGIATDSSHLQVIDYPALNQAFASIGIKGLNNGLTTEENQLLFTTDNIEQAIWLIVTGLSRINIKSQ